MGFLSSQLLVTPAYPRYQFTDKTVIVTGSNVGLGLEAARHITRLNAKKVILAVRNLEAGEKAKQSIEASTKRTGVVEVWSLDLSSFDSVKAFAEKAKKLDRLDVLLENAGIATDKYRLMEDNESQLTVNVLSTFLLGLLLLPKLQETADKFKTRPHLTIVSSEVHGWCKFPECDSHDIFAALNDEDAANMGERYPVSKLLEVLVVRQIAGPIAQGKNKDVIVNMLNPGLCHSSLSREGGWGLEIMKLLIGRSTEVGSRTLLHGIGWGPESHGTYMSDGHPADDMVVPWVKTEEGDRVGKKVWQEVKAKLEAASPGVTSNIE